MNAVVKRTQTPQAAPEHPLTGNQERFWFLHRYETDPSVLSLGTILEMTGSATDAELSAAVQRVVERNPQLMMRFRSTPSGVRVQPAGSSAATVRCSTLESADPSLVQSRLGAALQTPLDLELGRTAAFEIVRAGGRAWLCIVLHPSIADARSLTLVSQAFANALASGDSGQEGAHELHDTNAMWSNDAEAERYWCDRVGFDPSPLELPRFVPRPTRKQYATRSVVHELSSPLLDALRTLATRLDSSIEQVGCAAFVAALHRWSRQETVTIGRTVDRRPPGSERAIGPYENVLPLRIDFAESMSFASLDDHLERELERGAPFEGLPFDRLARTLQRSRDTSRHPVFQALFRFDAHAAFAAQLSDLTLTERRDLAPRPSPFDVSFELVVADDRQRVQLDYDAALFERAAMTSFVAHWANLVRAASEAPETPIHRLSMLTTAEVARQLEVLNVPVVTSPAATCVDLFRQAAQRAPTAPAVTFGDTTLRYAELDTLTDALAARLSSLGVSADVCVGVCLERSIAMVASVLAVLKAGGAYVPMDPSYPTQRLVLMAEDASAPLVITDERTRGTLGSQLGRATRLMTYEELRSLSGNDPPPPIEPPVGDALAYVIFTSGSTGRPKGVAMPHRALANLIEWQIARKTFRPSAPVLQYSSLSFDVSFQELFSTWASGGQLHLIADADRRDPRRLLTVLEEARIERLFLPYVALRQLVEVARTTQRYPRTLREVITAGEQLRVDDALRDFFRAMPEGSLDNQYGPSETHVVTAELLEGDPSQWPDLPPIGKPIDNTQVYLLDAHGALVPEGVTGEIYLAGACLARGYLGRDELTRERFVASPVGAIARSRFETKAYKTGDLGRYLPNGAIEFLGRADQQVKIRGHRIEPGEIDAVLGEVSGVKACVTKVVEEGGSKRLVSYVLVDRPHDFDRGTAISHAKARLPEYMVPATIVVKDAFPFTPSGKVDVRALAAPETDDVRAGQTVAPRTATERALAEIWRRVLNANDLGVHDSFFDLGGDSLKAVDLFLEIERRFSQDLPLALLAEHPSIEALAKIIDRGGAHEMSRFHSLRVIQRGDESVTPLFLVHGGGGNVVIFRELAKHLPQRQPLFAFEWDGWSRYRGQSNVPAMARLYADELMAFQPVGPIRLGGHCIGGLIAIEMAIRLRAAGREIVGPLIITDTPNLAASTHRSDLPSSGPDLAQLEKLRTELDARIRVVPSMHSTPFTMPRRSVTYQRVVRMVGRIHRLISSKPFNRWTFEQKLDTWHLRACLWTALPIPRELRSAYCGRTMVAAARRFRSTGYDGDVLYFRTKVLTGREMGLPGWWTDPNLGFEELCRGQFTAHYINADHNAVVGHPLTAEIVQRETRSS